MVFTSVAASANADQVKSYNPLFQYQKPGHHLPIASWSSNADQSTQAPSTRPQLSGLWSRDVELLEDSLLRKHGRLLQDSNSKARKLIAQTYPRNTQSTARLRGFFAEAIYLDRHPDEHYVKKFNAKHNDVYRMVNGVPDGAQIKTKVTFSGPAYEIDMRKDYLAKRFIVPDNHVEPLRSHLTEQEQIYRIAGDIKNAEKTHRMLAKIRPLGATSQQLQSRLNSAYRTISRAESAGYVSLGTAAGLGLAPVLWKYANGETSDGTALYQTTKTLSLVNVGMTVDRGLTSYKSGALRGTVKGNVITGAAVFTIETAYLFYEHGGTNALKQAGFWEEIGGSVSSLTLGTIVGGYVALWTAPLGVPVQATSAITAGMTGGIGGYIGGKSATRKLLEDVAPEIALKAEKDSIAEVRNSLEMGKSRLLAI